MGTSTVAFLLGLGCSSTPAAEPSPTAESPSETEVSLRQRPRDRIAGEVVALAYSGYRSGQHPDRGQGARFPSPAQIREDLDLIQGLGVRLIRLYDAGPLARRVLGIIEEDERPLQVVQGAWLQAEVSSHETCAWVDEPVPPEALDAHRAKNRAEIARAIELARRYSTVVVAVNVGNEALVTWNDHLVSIEAMVAYLREVGSAIDQPVTTADNYVAWAEHADELRDVVDFAFVHTYPVWEGKGLNEALDYTRANLEQVRRALPGVPLAIGEAGWPSRATEFGARASEAKQIEHLRSLLDFGRAHDITVFVFEAFDEDWKGNADPNGAEKHWGVFRVDRTPKAAARAGIFSAPSTMP